MPIEHRVRETIDTFTTRVRRDLDAHLRGLLSDMTRLFQDAQEGFRGELERAVNDARVDGERVFRTRLESVRAEMAREMDARLSAERTELQAALASVKAEMREDHVDAFGRLIGTIRRLDDVSSLSGLLETLARGAAVEASRVAILVVEGDMLRSWGHFGFAAGQGPVDMPVNSSGVLAAAVALKQTSFVSATVDGTDPTTPAFMHPPHDHIGVLAPIVVGGDVVAVLYADGVDRRPDSTDAAVWVEQVELMVRHTAIRLENITSVRTVEVLSQS